MAADENSYTGLIAGAHQGKERFTEWIYQLTQPLVEAQKTLIDGYKVFDLDLAEGEQLDALGVRIGVTRKLKIKIADVFFAFDDVDGKGFDFGIWQTPRDDRVGITVLSDEVYRQVLKAKVALNQYTGKNEDFAALLQQIQSAFGLSSGTMSYIDMQDMTINVYLDRSRIPPIVWELFSTGVLSLNHAGVLMNVIDGVVGNLATTKAVPLSTDTDDLLYMDIND